MNRYKILDWAGNDLTDAISGNVPFKDIDEAEYVLEMHLIDVLGIDLEDFDEERGEYYVIESEK